MTEAQLAEWLTRYGGAWSAHDGSAAAALFTDDAVYEWGPYSRLVGHDAIAARWDEATSDQTSARFTAELEGADGDRRFLRWHAILDEAIELDGFFVLDFAEDGRCQHLQEWWVSRPVTRGEARRTELKQGLQGVIEGVPGCR